MQLLPDLMHGVLLARRARYIFTSIWLIVASISMAILASEFSARQPATVAVDVGISTLRLLLPLMVIFLVQELLAKEFSLRYFLTSITYPRARYWLLLGRIATVVLLTYLLLAIMALVLMLLASQISNGYNQATPVNLGINYWITILFIAIDLFVLIAWASLLAIASTTPSFVLIGTLGFMLIARSYTSIITLLSQNQYVVANSEFYKNSLRLLHYLFPDLGALDVRTISLYGRMELLPDDWPIAVSTNLLYSFFLLVVAYYFLKRRQLS